LRTDGRGIVTTCSYDAENRLLSKTYSDSTAPASFYYDQTSFNGLTITNGKGRRTGMSDGSGQTAWSYNVLGQMLTEQKTIGTVTKTLYYSYNNDGSAHALTYPSGRYLTYSYNSAGQLAGIADGQTGYLVSPTYAPNGALAARFSNAFNDYIGWTYNQRFWPTSMVENVYGSAHLLNLSFSYSGNGNVSQVANAKDSTRTETITYDNLNRVSTAQSHATSGANCWGQSFSYDRYGNLTGIASTQCASPALSISVNAKNRVTNTGFAYDPAARDRERDQRWHVHVHLGRGESLNFRQRGDVHWSSP